MSKTDKVIIKVREDGYVPPGVEVRARLDGFIFTANINVADRKQVEADPLVVSISPNSKLSLID